jgi:hypothetical protein
MIPRSQLADAAVSLIREGPQIISLNSKFFLVPDTCFHLQFASALREFGNE